MAETIPIASDHAGFEMKEKLKAHLAALGFDVQDLGAHSAEPSDYPDFAPAVAELVSSGAVQRGVLLCGTGIGMAIAANRHPQVRAAVVWNPEVAKLTREHNDANVLVLPARLIEEPAGERILDAFLSTGFEGGRHARRVDKIEPTETHA